MAMVMYVRNSRAACLYFLLNSQCDLKLYWEKDIEGTKPSAIKNNTSG